MAKLAVLPEQAVIDGLKGTLDYYVLHLNPSEEKGIVCVRTWPRYRSEAYPESSKVTQPFFAYVNQMAAFISPEVQQAYEQMAAGTGLSWKDMMVRCYLNRELL